MTLKRIFKLSLGLLMALALFLAVNACFSDYGFDGQGLVTINIGGLSSARYGDDAGNPPQDEILINTSFEAIFYIYDGNEEESYTVSFSGTNSGRVYVPAGIYSWVSVTASHNGIEYAFGSNSDASEEGYYPNEIADENKPIIITAGKNDPINIQMYYQCEFSLAPETISLAVTGNNEGYDLNSLFTPIYYSKRSMNSANKINWSFDIYDQSIYFSNSNSNSNNEQKLFITEGALSHNPFYLYPRMLLDEDNEVYADAPYITVYILNDETYEGDTQP